MRCYLPATLDEIASSHLALPPRPAHAVTPELRAGLPDEDEEGLEYVAQLAAADDALALLAVAGDAPRLRVVVAADVPDDLVVPAPGAGRATTVRVATPVALAEVACVLVDEPAAAADVAGALADDEDARERLAERDLLWYDISELGHVPRG